jgi:hypothetical protein
LAGSAGCPATTIGLVTICSDRVRLRLLDDDVELRGLSVVTNPAVMAKWLGERLGCSADSCLITPVTYRPADRCVLRYDLSGPCTNTVVYGKVLSGERARDLASTVASLGESLTAPLVGFAPEWQLVVQADAGPRNMRAAVDAIARASDLAEVHATGKLLAKLHAGCGPPGAARSLSVDTDELRTNLVAAEHISPIAAAGLAAGIDVLRTVTDITSTSGPSHGAFRLDQVRSGKSGPKLIDFDSYGWAEPARDVANLLAYLRWRTVRWSNSTSAVTKVRRAFLAGYRDASSRRLDDDRVRVFEAASMLKIAERRYRRLAVDDWEWLPPLIDAALAQLGVTVSGTA